MLSRVELGTEPVKRAQTEVVSGRRREGARALRAGGGGRRATLRVARVGRRPAGGRLAAACRREAAGRGVPARGRAPYAPRDGVQPRRHGLGGARKDAVAGRAAPGSHEGAGGSRGEGAGGDGRARAGARGEGEGRCAGARARARARARTWLVAQARQARQEGAPPSRAQLQQRLGQRGQPRTPAAQGKAQAQGARARLQTLAPRLEALQQRQRGQLRQRGQPRAAPSTQVAQV